MSTMKFIDCTLRDGGYYNNWDFPIPVVEEYLKAMNVLMWTTQKLAFDFSMQKDLKVHLHLVLIILKFFFDKQQ